MRSLAQQVREITSKLYQGWIQGKYLPCIRWIPQLHSCGHPGWGVSPLLSLKLKHFTAEKTRAGRSDSKISEMLLSFAVRARRKDVGFCVCIWHLFSLPGNILASRLHLIGNVAFLNILSLSPLYSSTFFLLLVIICWYNYMMEIPGTGIQMGSHQCSSALDLKLPQSLKLSA